MVAVHRLLSVEIALQAGGGDTPDWFAFIQILKLVLMGATQLRRPHDGQGEQTEREPRDRPGVIFLRAPEHFLQALKIGDCRLSTFANRFEDNS